MEIIRGTGVAEGVVCGKIRLIRRRIQTQPSQKYGGDPESEMSAFRRGCDVLTAELTVLGRKTKETAGEAEAEIFDIHRMMLEDEGFTEPTEHRIKNGMGAQAAIAETGRELAELFSAMDDPYMKAREADIRGITERLIRILNGTEEMKLTFDTPVILAAEELTPAQTLELDSERVLGLVTEKGSSNSHTAILARSLGIPSITAAGNLSDTIDGREAILDGARGILYVDPTPEIVEEYRNAEYAAGKPDTEGFMHNEVLHTKGGKQIRIFANAGSLREVKAALAAGAEGIGLFRSEFLFMQYDRCPTEEEQFQVYRDLLQTMGEREVTIRTLDAGADKQIPWLNRDMCESNPALGLRAVRLCLANPRLLYTQLRALYRASAYGNLRVMIPLITIREELEQVQRIAENVRTGLKNDGISYKEAMPIGMMVETPSAALLADKLAKKAAFFSLGTNDLTQYTMAADRENASVSYLTECMPEAVAELIRITAEAAAKAGISVSVCGELASDKNAIPFLLDAGITTLSVSPGQIAGTRKTVIRHLSGTGES
ncbi:MAG: phosphoenolpyruvate--protein phosphotransferase [Clostridia bacterium]|nr:phosphoenolpyruvate--protein phosphotransferase [Clostridia bacterium]